MENKINPGHKKQRGVLRILGTMFLVMGVIFGFIGAIDFFSAMGTVESPKLFWCFFAAAPLLFFGVVLSSLGFMGSVIRDHDGKASPVGKDTFNNMAKETVEEEPTIEARLHKLDALRVQGLIDDEDYKEQKDRILNEL